MRSHRLALLALAILLTPAVAGTASAQGKPFQLALFNPAQIVPETESIAGLRINLLYGVNQDVQGVDWGLVNHVRGGCKAWQSGIVGIVEKDFTGWQDCWVNITRGEFTGFASGGYNQAENGHGFMLGFVNVTRNMRGFQLGVLNVTETLDGLQIGVGNVIQKGRFQFLPIVNWSM